MEYILIKWENEEFWIEIAEDIYGKHATRQIVVDGEGIHVSCFECCLSEGTIDYSELGGEIIKIESHEFEGKWLESTSEFLDEWTQSKNKYPIGSSFSGKMCYYYPQGAILKNQNIFAVATNENSGKVYPGHLLSGEVVGYDDTNYWLIIDPLRGHGGHGDGEVPRKENMCQGDGRS